MKKVICIITAIVSWQAAVSQNTWVAKATFSGSPRSEATGFSIGNTGYILSGFDGAYPADVYAWDQGNNIWIQKNNFPSPRRAACATSHNGKGYVFFGNSPGALSDFWIYDPVLDSWTQKNNFPGQARRFSTAVSNGNKIYIIAGDPLFYTTYLFDVWEYDPVADTWAQKANFPGGQRSGGVGFAIGSLIYFGTGNDNMGNDASNDLWQYDPSSNSWLQRASIPNTPSAERRVGGAFSACNFGYLGLGWESTSPNTYIYHYDFWQYDPSANLWTQMANFPGVGAYTPVSFAINGRGYFGTGGTASGSTNQFYEYYNCGDVGISENLQNQNQLIVYPNPSNGNFTLRMNVSNENIKLEIYNSVGEKILEEIPRDNEFKLNTHLPSGIYILKISEGNNPSIIEKLVIE